MQDALINTYVHTYIHAYGHAFMQAYIHTDRHTYTCIHTYIFTAMHTHIYAYTYTDIFMYLHKYTCLRKRTVIFKARVYICIFLSICMFVVYLRQAHGIGLSVKQPLTQIGQPLF